MNTEKNGSTRTTNKEVIILNYTPPNVSDVVSSLPKNREALQVQQNVFLEEMVEVE